MKNLIKIGEFLYSHLILKMEENMQHFQHSMLYHFKKGKNIIETQKKICAVHGEGAVPIEMCQKCFTRFCA